MNSLKTLFIIAVLGAVAYGVYVSINRNPETPAASDTAPAWPEAPEVQLPGPGAATPQFPPAVSGADTAPRFSSGLTAAPADGPSAAGSPRTASGASAAPPYRPLGTSAPPIGAPPTGTAPPNPATGGSAATGSVASADTASGADNLRGAPSHAANPGVAANSLRAAPRSVSELPAGQAAEHDGNEKLMAFMQAVQVKLDEGRLAEALLALSSLYGNPDLPPAYAQKVTELLDQLAGTVIYSRQHLLEPAYRVRPGETLEQIAQTYNVPCQLLAKINGIRDPQQLEPGRELKVIRGPFGALIDLDKYELTLMVGGCYAGRFPIGVGRDHPNLEGSYAVRDKRANPAGSSPGGAPGNGDPHSNPLGRYWIDLGNQVGIHGTSDPQNLHRTGGPGSVCLGDQDIEDIFGILSIGSRVIIQR